MYRLKRHISRHTRFLWVLAAAVCLMQILPLHLHLHHTNPLDHDTGTYVTDLHLATSPDDQEHHHEAHVIDMDANGILKMLDADTFVPLLLLFLLTFVFVPPANHWWLCPTLMGVPPRQRYLEFAPLRAPPQV